MKTATIVAQTLVRVTGVFQIVLGFLFWTGNATFLIPVHMLSGLLLVLGLWALAGLGARAGVQAGLVAVAAVWGLLTVALGVSQDSILQSGPHWVIQVLHLLVGLGAIGQAEALGVRIRRALGPLAPAA